jgi:hypothetical protein
LVTGNAASRIDSEAGSNSAAPAPCTARIIHSISMREAIPQPNDPPTNIASPSRNIRLRPLESARRPAGTSNAANTSV